MKLTFARGMLMCGLLACGACSASASLASTRDASANTRYVRIYVTVDQGNAAAEYADALTRALLGELGRRGVTVKSRIRRGIELDDQVVDAEIGAWKPDGILIVDFAGGAGSGFALEQASYDASLIDAASQRRIWRGQTQSSRGFGTTSGMMEATAAEIANRLAQDRLIAAPR